MAGGLAPPGSSSYTSNTLHVGDGTWDSSRDDFLLPNLVGLNFATMRYNGMGNRFFTMTGYHSLVEAHGAIAAITFLGIIPAAIFLTRFYGRNPRNALRFHIWLQIMTLILSTVVVILGFFAVGPKRALTNPHHGIGVAIYVLIWFQVLGGCMVHRSEKKRYHIPLRAMLHHWLGRSIALLGIVQVALGLTLYGSPQYLFVLYTLFVFALVLLYFILEFLHERRRETYGSEGSYSSEEVVEGRQDRKHGGLGKLAAAGAAGVGLAALFRRRSQNQSGHSFVDNDESGTSYITDEKVHETAHHGWGRRILEIGAIGGVVAAANRVFNRRNRNDSSSDVGPYKPPLGGNQSVTTDSMSRIEEGRPPPMSGAVPPGGSPGFIRPSHPLAAPPMTPDRRNSGSSYSYASFNSGSPSRRDRRHTWRNALAGGGVVLAARSLFKGRRQKKEERRAEDLRTQRTEEERIARMNSAHRYTGDGITPPRRFRNDRMASQSDSDFTGSFVDGPPGMNPAIPIAGPGVAAAAALADRNRVRPVGMDPVIAPPGPPMAMPTDIPPIPPAHRTASGSSGSEMYTTASGRPHHRHRVRDEAAAALAGAALGAAATDRRRHSGRNTDSMESPPVSLKVKMHNDGRHVTLRRLTEEEAAAQRDARRQERRASSGRRRRNSSFGSSSGGEPLGAGSSSDRRWRRAEAVEAQQEAENRLNAAAAAVPATAYPPPPPPGSHAPPFAPAAFDSRTGQTYNVPPPPPIPGSSSGIGNPAGSVTSPGTETSGATEYANNRRRRRAERAQAKLAREGRAGGGNTVDFT